MRAFPERGDLIWLEFGSPAGHEQGGRRPALVVSRSPYNRIGLAVVCPITSRVKGYPFEVAVPDGLPIGGVALTDQLRSVAWQVRGAELIGRMPADAMAEVLAKIAALVG